MCRAAGICIHPECILTVNKAEGALIPAFLSCISELRHMWWLRRLLAGRNALVVVRVRHRSLHLQPRLRRFCCVGLRQKAVRLAADSGERSLWHRLTCSCARQQQRWLYHDCSVCRGTAQSRAQQQLGGRNYASRRYTAASLHKPATDLAAGPSIISSVHGHLPAAARQFVLSCSHIPLAQPAVSIARGGAASSSAVRVISPLNMPSPMPAVTARHPKANESAKFVLGNMFSLHCLGLLRAFACIRQPV